jgi:uncharacterized membrane protein
MTKLEFILALNEKLSAYPKAEVQQRLSFYSEMIEDRMEDGLSEEEAVAAVGDVERIAAEIAAELTPEEAPKPPKPAPREWKTWAIVLLIVGSPVWVSLAVGAGAAVLSLYASVWAVIISLWAVFGALAACGVCGILCGIGFAFGGYIFPGLAVVAAALVCAGLSILAFFGCKAITDLTVTLTKRLFMRKKEAAK